MTSHTKAKLNNRNVNAQAQTMLMIHLIKTPSVTVQRQNAKRELIIHLLKSEIANIVLSYAFYRRYNKMRRIIYGHVSCQLMVNQAIRNEVAGLHKCTALRVTNSFIQSGGYQFCTLVSNYHSKYEYEREFYNARLHLYLRGYTQCTSDFPKNGLDNKPTGKQQTKMLFGLPQRRDGTPVFL
jgi:hypothetical protein